MNQPHVYERVGWAIEWSAPEPHYVGVFAVSHRLPEHMFPYRTIVFETRAQARAFIARKYGYIKERPDLRAAPFFWKMPRPVRVKVITTIAALERVAEEGE